MRVLLICMPFAALDRPALGLSVLKPAVQAAGHECDVAYLNLDFAAFIGAADYRRVAEDMPFAVLAGEWAFAESVWGPAGAGAGDYVGRILSPWRVAAPHLESLERAHSLAGPFLEEKLATVDWGAYDLVGFSSFGAQNVASLALAKRVKERHPELPLVIGGHNWTGSMGVALHAHVPFIDYAFLGEADESFPRLLTLLEEGQTDFSIPGVSPGGEHLAAERSPASLDDLPMPDHSDYFEQVGASGLPEWPCVVPFEASRGCWWAAGSGGCTFCALNDGAPGYRSKSPGRILSEIRELGDRWPDCSLEVVDNVVSSRFIQDVLPRLAEEPPPHGISMKVRPGIAPEHLVMAGRAGGSLLCGIESLSDDLLVLMNKGVIALEAVRLLKWCDALGIAVDWNMLWGIPGDGPEDYRSQVDLVARLTHLEPPDVVAPVTLERSSVLWRRAFGADEKPAPAEAYTHVYPFSLEEIGEFAFFFESGYVPTLRTGLQVSRLAERVSMWRAGRDPGRLVATSDERGMVTLRDTRGDAGERTVVLSRSQSLIYSACDDPVTMDELLELARRESGDVLSAQDVVRTLADLEADGFLVRSGPWCINLATPVEDADASCEGG
jgi:ribosomal peptide maturation radical SAM protein 1